MKQLILIMSLALSINAYAQDDKTVTLVVSGQGKTQDEAKQNALRSAIEQAFGTFISSKTEILNDNLVKDEIISVANGNIQKFEIISEVQIPSGNYVTSLKATVSVTKLTSFVESKGVVVEFKGGLFAFNINQQKINEQNEVKAINEIINVTTKILSKSFEATIRPSDPVFNGGDNYMLPIDIEIKANENMNIATDYFLRSINNLCMPKSEVDNYNIVKKPFHYLYCLSSEIPITGQMEFYLWEEVACNSKPNCKGWRDQKSTLEEYVKINNNQTWNRFKLGVKPDFKSKNYFINNIILRNKISIILVQRFIESISNYALEFSIYSQNMEKISFAREITLGSLPINTYEQQMNFCYDEFKVINYISGGFSNLVSNNIPYTKNFSQNQIFFIQRYSKDNVVLKIKGSSNLSLEEIKNISSLKIQYN